MKRIRVEPISTYLERRRKGPIYPVVVGERPGLSVRARRRSIPKPAMSSRCRSSGRSKSCSTR